MCVVRKRSQRRADHSYRRVLLLVVCLSMIVMMRRPWPTRGCCAMGEKIYTWVFCIWKCKNYNFTREVVPKKRLKIPYTFSAWNMKCFMANSTVWQSNLEYTGPKRKYWNNVQKYEQRRTWPLGNEQAIKRNWEETETQVLRFRLRTHALCCLFIKHDTVACNGFSIRTYGIRNKKLVSP